MSNPDYRVIPVTLKTRAQLTDIKIRENLTYDALIRKLLTLYGIPEA